MKRILTYVGLLPILVFLSCERKTDEVYAAWQAATENVAVAFAPSVERRQAPVLLKKLFGSLNNPKQQSLLIEEFAELGLELRSWKRNAVQYLMLSENTNARRGRGFFLLRETTQQPWLLQAPHSFSDTGTGKLALKLFFEGSAAAVALNTAERDELDLAHESDTFYQSFTEMFIESFPKAYVLQLHGFDNDKRKTTAGRDAALILSSGTETPKTHAVELHRSMKQAFGSHVLLYPNEVVELGGTKNAQMRLISSAGTGAFVHLELSRHLRKQLLDSAKIRKRFLEALQEGLE